MHLLTGTTIPRRRYRPRSEGAWWRGAGDGKLGVRPESNQGCPAGIARRLAQSRLNAGTAPFWQPRILAVVSWPRVAVLVSFAPRNLLHNFPSQTQQATE